MESMTLEEFNRIVDEVVADLPDEFAKALANVEIVTEIWPSRQDMTDSGGHHGSWLFGLYRGVPQTHRSNYNAAIPDKIVIFAGPILNAHWPDMNEVKHQIKSTVLHEIGHHFGMSETEIRKAERARSRHIYKQPTT
jgi:predicted Zn-dependent protease with MMP-like domain